MVYVDESVTGLAADSPVEFNGVNVGRVKMVSLSKKDPHLVEVILSVRKETPITQGTLATLNSRGLTGITYMALKDKGTNLAALPLFPDQRYPIIKSSPSFLLRLDTEFQRLNKSLSDVSAAMTKLLDDENLHSVKLVLTNLKDFTQILQAQNNQIKTLIANASSSSEQLPEMMKSGNKAIQTLHSQTLPAATRTMVNLDRASQNLTMLSDEVKQNPSVLLRGIKPQLGPGEN